ncbi:unnamed protein product, partial [marine sediment metagenome]
MAQGARILAVGEVLWDCFGNERRLGGAPFNFGYYAAALGAESAVISAVGADPSGREIRRRARAEQGFSLASRRRWEGRRGDGPHPCALHLQRDSQHPTGVVRVTLDEAGNPTFRILTRRAWDFI